MAGNNVRALVDQLLGKPGEQEQLHIQTVKITKEAHAKLRALADLAGRSKTPLAADLLTAAIDDAIAALPNEPVDDPALEEKLLGVYAPHDAEPYTLGVLVGWAAERYLQEEARQADEEEKRMVSNVEAQLSGRNGARK